MITEWFLSFLHTLSHTFLGQMDALIPDPPGWWSDLSSAVGSVAAIITPVGHWIPTGLIISVAGSLLLLNGVHVGIVLVRRIASYLTLGGGAL